MRMFLRDIGFATRTLRKNAAFSLTAVLTLALGIGATTAIFSVVNAVLLRPLPYEQPDRLTIIWGELRTRQVYDWPFAPGDIKDLMDQATLFDGIAALRTNPAPLLIEGAPPQQIQTANVTPNVFSVLGVKVARGRGFTAEDGRPQPRPPQQPEGVVGGQQATPQGPPPQRLPQIAVLSDGFCDGSTAAIRPSSERTSSSDSAPCRSWACSRPTSSSCFRPRRTWPACPTSGCRCAWTSPPTSHATTCAASWSAG